MHALERQTRHALGQVGGFGEQAQAQLVGVEAEQLTGIVREVPHQDLVLVAGVLGQRPDQGHAAALVAEHARDVQERLPVRAGLVQPGFGQHGAFLAQLQAEVPQAGLGLLEQACQGDGGAHVRQGIVGGLVAQAIGLGEVLQLEGGAAVVMLGPLDAFGAQGPGGAHHVQQVPAAAAVLPFAGIGVDEVAPEQVTRDLVVKADGVVAHADGVRLGQFVFDGAGKRVLGHALLQAGLRQDAGEQAGFGFGQVVGRGRAVLHQRLADLVEVHIGAHAGELRGAVATRHLAEGFVVVPVESEIAAHDIGPAESQKRKPGWTNGPLDNQSGRLDGSIRQISACARPRNPPSNRHRRSRSRRRRQTPDRSCAGGRR